MVYLCAVAILALSVALAITAQKLRAARVAPKPVTLEQLGTWAREYRAQEVTLVGGQLTGAAFYPPELDDVATQQRGAAEPSAYERALYALSNEATA